MFKKFLLATLIILVLIAVGFFIWYYFLYDNQGELNPAERFNLFRTDPVDVSDNPVIEGSGNGVQFRIDGEDEIEEQIPVVRKISNAPISGYTTFVKEVEFIEEVPVENNEINEESASTTTDDIIETEEIITIRDEIFIRYIDRATGNVFEAMESALPLSRISKTTIPKIQEAVLNKIGESAVLRYLNDNNIIQSFIASLVEGETLDNEDGESTTIFELEGEFLPQEILSLNTNPAGDKIFYILEGTNGGAVGYINNFNNTNPELIFNSPLRDWNVDWVNENTITLTTKPHSTEPGIMFKLNVNTGSLTKLLGGIDGLTGLLHPNEKYLLYSEGSRNEINLFVKNLEENTVEELSFQTMPEKCVWDSLNETTLYCAFPELIPRVSYPESWYVGNVFLNDALWKVDVDLMSYDDLMGDRERVDQSFDMVELSVSEDGDYLYFRNKQDLELWSIDLSRI